MASSNNSKKKSGVKKKNTTTKKSVNKNKTKVVEPEVVDNGSLSSKIIVVSSVLIVLSLFYLLAIHITNKNAGLTDDKADDSDVGSDYSEILLGSSFNRDEKEYLVVYYDRENEDISSSLSTSITDYSSKDKSLTVYTVDMSNMFNKKYNTSDEVNKSPESISELRINGPTLIKFSDGKVTEYINGLDSIKDYLG